MRHVICLLFAIGIAHAQNAEFRGERGVIRLTGFSDLSVDVPSGRTIARANGASVKIEDTGSGLTLSGRQMTVTLRRSVNGQTVVESAEVAGAARAVVDSSIALASQQSIAQRKGTAIPVTPNELSVSTIESERMSYKTEGEEGVLTVPAAVQYLGKTTGTGIRQFEQTLRLEGASATIRVTAPEGDRKAAPRTAEIQGPVQFFFDRSEIREGKPEVSKVQGRADRFTADFVLPPDPELKADGNVRMEGDFNGMPGTVTGSLAVITLDRSSYQPLRFRVVGTPVSTKVTIKEGKG